MAAKKPTPLFQLGNRVRIHHSEWRGRIVELRGPLAPGGVFVYRIRIPDKPKPFHIEVPEDELTSIPARTKAKPSPNGTTLPKATTETPPLFGKGDRVEIHQTDWQGRIIDLRFRRAPETVYIYRVRVPAEPRSIYIELPENYLVTIPSPVKKKSRRSSRRVQGERKEK